MYSTIRLAGAFALAAAGGWVVRHAGARTVRRWRRPTGPTVMAAQLHTRVVGTGDPAIVLLHGIVGCGDYFGASYDGLGFAGRRLVVPDLLGFGDSYRASSAAGYGLDAHLTALDKMADALGLSGPLIVVGHSMGAVLALHWAASRHLQIERVFALSAPLYTSPSEGLAHVRGLGRLEALMASDGPVARAACAWMCRHRTTAGWVAAAIKPHLPVRVARRGVLHTWPAYLGSMEHIVLHSPWRAAVTVLAEAEVPVVFAAGDRDPVPVAGRAERLAAQHASLTSIRHPRARHDLPLDDPRWCRQLLDSDGACT